MPPVVPRHTASPRTSPGPRNTVPQEHRRCASLLSVCRPMGGTQAYCRYSSPSSVLRPIVSVRRMVGTQAQCSTRPRASAQAQCQYPAQGRYASAVPEPKPMGGAQPIVSAHSPWLVPTQKTEDRRPASARLGPTRMRPPVVKRPTPPESGVLLFFRFPGPGAVRRRVCVLT
jgi:hypothetical protein